MTLFEYVSVMVSVVLALGIAQILSGLGRLLLSRGETRPYWIHSLWIVFFALLHVLLWWFLWDLRERPPETVPTFLYLLAGPAMAYLGTYVLLGGGFPDDAGAHFYRVRRPFFALQIAGTCYQLLTPFVWGYELPVLFRVGAVAAAAAAVIGLLSADRRAQAVIALFSVGTLVGTLIARVQIGVLRSP